MLPDLKGLDAEIVVELAHLPTQMRGFGHVKHESVAATQTRREELLRKLRHGDRRAMPSKEALPA